MKAIINLIVPGILLSCIALLNPEATQAQVSQAKEHGDEGKTPLLSRYSWHTFEGTIGSQSAQISLYLFDDKTIKGNYVIDNGAKVMLSGNAQADSLVLQADSPIVRLTGIVAAGTDSTRDHIAGIITNQSGEETAPFYGALSSITSGSFDHRYSDMAGTTEEVEAFMKKVQTAILTDDKAWLSTHIAYPLRYRSSIARLTVNNRQQFQKQYHKFITPELKERIKDVPATNLFHKLGRAMLGNGAVWIGNTRESTDHHYDFAIIAIN